MLSSRAARVMLHSRALRRRALCAGPASTGPKIPQSPERRTRPGGSPSSERGRWSPATAGRWPPACAGRPSSGCPVPGPGPWSETRAGRSAPWPPVPGWSPPESTSSPPPVPSPEAVPAVEIARKGQVGAAGLQILGDLIDVPAGGEGPVHLGIAGGRGGAYAAGGDPLRRGLILPEEIGRLGPLRRGAVVGAVLLSEGIVAGVPILPETGSAVAVGEEDLVIPQLPVGLEGVEALARLIDLDDMPRSVRRSGPGWPGRQRGRPSPASAHP